MQLGNNSLPQGYLTKEWLIVQNQWLCASNTNSKGKNWIKEMITSLHTYTYSVWKWRNDILHKDAVKSIKVLRRQRLQQRTTDLYQRGRANFTPRQEEN